MEATAAAAAAEAAAAAAAASAAARAQAAQARGASADGNGGASTAAAGPGAEARRAGGTTSGSADPTANDSTDGYTEVVHRGTRRQRRQELAAARGEAAGIVGAPAIEATGDPNAMQLDEVEDLDDEDAEAVEEEEEPADPAALRRRWDKEAATVRLLAREGTCEAHPVMRAAVAARDAAERAYKQTRSPHPVARRMGWAQGRLDRALRLQTRTRLELQAFDEDVKAKRQKYLDKLDDDLARVSKHRQALDELQVEASAEIASPAHRGGESRAACDRAAGGLRSAAPRAAALAESLPEGSPARDEANLLLTHLANLQAELELAAEGGAGPEAYNIADDASETEWSESHDLAPAGAGQGAGQGNPATPPRPPKWQAEGFGRWNKGKGKHNAPPSPSAAVQQPQSAAEAAASAATASQGATATPPRATQLTAGAAHPPVVLRDDLGAASAGDGAGDGSSQRAKHRRGQQQHDSAEAAAAVQNTRNAVELYQQQAAGVAAGFNTPAGVQLAGRQHAQRVAAITAKATELGVQPLTEDGQDLIIFGPGDLRSWAEKHLKDDATW